MWLKQRQERSRDSSRQRLGIFGPVCVLLLVHQAVEVMPKIQSDATLLCSRDHSIK
jgi:hypothetical protein